MLILKRRVGQSITIEVAGYTTTVILNETERNAATIAIDAPPEVKIRRSKIASIQ